MTHPSHALAFRLARFLINSRRLFYIATALRGCVTGWLPTMSWISSTHFLTSQILDAGYCEPIVSPPNRGFKVYHKSEKDSQNYPAILAVRPASFLKTLQYFFFF